MKAVTMENNIMVENLVKCIVCGKLFPRPHRSSNPKYCSDKCYVEGSRMLVRKRKLEKHLARCSA